MQGLRRRFASTWRIWAPPLRWRIAAMRHLWGPGAQRRVRLSSRAAQVPIGRIDTPGAGAELERGPTVIRGWALFPAEPVSHVDVWLGDELLGRARVGMPRPDVALLREQPGAGVSGFELSTDIAGWKGPPTPTPVRVLATSVGGGQHELDRVTVEVVPPAKGKPGKVPPPLAVTPRPPGRDLPRVLVVTHQLNLGGAQLYLLDLLRELVKGDMVEPTVVSAMDGELRQDLEELGIPVHISSLVPMDDVSSHIGRVEELAAWAADRDFDVALVNTATALTFPGARAARQLGIPVVWAIHESFLPSILWSAMDPETRALAEEALEDAALALFEAEATQRLFEPPLQSSQCLTVPYGLDLAPIERERAEFDMTAARREARVPADADVVLCVGTVEPRKAQIPLAIAFEQIASRHPDAQLVIVGGADNPDSKALARQIEESRFGDRMRLVPITPDVHSWYALADLFVCASDVESLPRTILEAMAFETPVLATEVFGIPELIEDGKTGWLCEPRDVSALAAGLDRFLGTPADERRAVAEAARTLVEERHSLPQYANQISKLLGKVVEENSSESKRRIVSG